MFGVLLIHPHSLGQYIPLGVVSIYQSNPSPPCDYWTSFTRSKKDIKYTCKLNNTQNQMRDHDNSLTFQTSFIRQTR